MNNIAPLLKFFLGWGIDWMLAHCVQDPRFNSQMEEKRICHLEDGSEYSLAISGIFFLVFSLGGTFQSLKYGIGPELASRMSLPPEKTL